MKKWIFPTVALFFLTACCGKTVYRDGVFRGEAMGYSKETPIKVEVTVAGGNMVSVEVVDHGEYVEQVPQVQEALNTLPGAMVKKNTTYIDSIAGATETSKGIKNAVEKALERAK